MAINCKGTLIDLTRPKVMGILNCTPDSFFDGGKFKSEKSILDQVNIMLKEGATFIDVGAYSSRPGAEEVSVDLELKRIIPVVELILKKYPESILSIDTFRSKVAQECINAGASIINDISAGLHDENMLKTIAQLKVPYIMMHMRGTSKTMQQQTFYKNLIEDVLYFFSQRLAVAKSLGIIDLIIDPGFGFAKTLEQNYELLQKLQAFNLMGHPLLVGMSRKSMIYKLLDTTPDTSLNGTTALHMVALDKGAQMLRVHDVKEAMECIQLHQQLTS